MTQASRSRETSRGISFGPPGPGAIGAGEHARDTRSTARRLWGYLRRQRLGLVGIFALVAASTVFDSLGPYLMGRAIDRYILKHDLPGLAHQVLLMLGVYMGTSAAVWLQNYVMAAVAQRTVRDIRNDLFAKLQTLSLRFFDQRSRGELMSRLTNDVENVSTVLTESVTQFFSSIMMLVGVTAFMLWLNWRLALVSLVTIPLMVALTTYVAGRTRRGYQRQQHALGELNGFIEETISGMRVVKAYAQEATAIAMFDSANLKLRSASTTAQTFTNVLGPLSNMVNNIGYAIVAGAGGWMAVQGLATVGVIASFVDYARRLSRPLSDIAALYNSIQSAIAGAERAFGLLDEVPEPADAKAAPALRPILGEVVFDDVSFAYDEGVPVLRNVSLRAKRGQTIALVGPTGAGKTTIVNVLTRFYDIDDGRIIIDGQDIHAVRKDSLRCQLGIVLQDTFLFSATVMENIRYGRLDATDEEVEAAARLANADFFVRRLPHAYKTLVAEQGSNLSQGQRQLLAIARTILADPGILVLDEAMSSVDTRTEAHIRDALLRLMKGRTSFVIAHRLSTIRDADEILVINAGRIVEHGTHSQLLADKGFYHGLYMSQFREQAAAT